MWFPNTRVIAKISTPASDCWTQRARAGGEYLHGVCTNKQLSWIVTRHPFVQGDQLLFINIPPLLPFEPSWLKCHGNTETGEHITAGGREDDWLPPEKGERWKNTCVRPLQVTEQTLPAHIKMLECLKEMWPLCSNLSLELLQDTPIFSQTFHFHYYYYYSYHKAIEDIVLKGGNTEIKIIDILLNVLPYFFYTYFKQTTNMLTEYRSSLAFFHVLHYEHLLIPNHNVYSALLLWLCYSPWNGKCM